jgi:thiol-disulfide isomerase/thioredoxin
MTNTINNNKVRMMWIVSAIAVLFSAIVLVSPITSTKNNIRAFASDDRGHAISDQIVQQNLTKTQFKIDKSQFKKAPEFAQITGYINTRGPIKISDLKGKVVLVHFWTYTCINCIHTIPSLNDWYQKYADKGLVIVSIHRPEFEFEKNIDNVKAAVQQYGIKYSVLQDNNYGTWNAYGNIYWPRDYLIDNQGFIRYNHVGEGGYDQTEKTIQSLLAEGVTL